MATYKQGILGAFSGKVGNIIGTFWKGQSVMRVVAPNYTDANTVAQQTTRMKFSLMVKFVNRAIKLISFGFGAFDSKMTAINAALKNNFTAFTGTFPNLSIDYSKVKLSMGARSQLKDLQADSTLAGTIDLTWVNELNDASSDGQDSVMAAAIDTATGNVISFIDVANRVDESAVLDLPDGYSGKNLTVIAFTVDNPVARSIDSASQVSESQNLGSVTVA